MTEHEEVMEELRKVRLDIFATCLCVAAVGILIILLMIIGTGDVHAADFPNNLESAAVASAVFDVTSTYSVLKRCPRCEEWNPVLRPAASSWPKYSAVLGAATVGEIWISRHLTATGHPKLAKAVLWSVIGVHVGAGIHNLRIGR